MCIANETRRRSLTMYQDFESRVMNDETNSHDSATSTGPSNKEKREVQHHYHDHAEDTGAEYIDTPVVSKGGVTVPFPLKLHNMLAHIDLYESELSSIVSWQPHGRCFLVHNIKAFTADVLHRFFQQKKYASFQRQLNLYGFNRITSGPDRGSYYHELFLRGKTVLCRGINRMKVKGTGSRMASNPEQEPNFYKMQCMPASVAEADNFEKGQPGQPASVPSAVSYCSSLELNKPKTLPCAQPLSYSGSDNNVKVEDDNDDDDLNFVFDLPFHELDGSESTRRHSLMNPRRLSAISLSSLPPHRLSMVFSRRNSLPKDQRKEFTRRLSVELARRTSVVLVDDQFEKDMESISKLGNEKELTDEELCQILDKIVDHRFI